MFGIGFPELLILVAVPVLGLASLAVIFVVIRAAVRSGNHASHKGK